MKTCLIESIAKENNFTIIKKLDENNKQYLKEHIQKTILDRYDYNPLEHIQEMINEVIDWFEDELQAINYIQSINYNINDTFYEKLKEDYFDSQDDTICDWEDEFEKPKEDIKLILLLCPGNGLPFSSTTNSFSILIFLFFNLFLKKNSFLLALEKIILISSIDKSCLIAKIFSIVDTTPLREL